MKKLWMQLGSDLKWHGAGLAWLVFAVALGYAVGWGQGKNSSETGPAQQRTLATQASSAPRPVLAANVAGPTQTQHAPDLRIWEVTPVLPARPDDKVKPLTPEFWKVSGVFENPQGRRVIVEYQSPRASEYLKVGGTLPNGARIVAVDPKSITVKTKVANQWKTIVLDFDVNNF